MKHNFLYHIKHNFVLRNTLLAVSLLFIILASSFILLDVYTKRGEEFTLPNLNGLTMQDAKDITKNMESRLVVIDSMFISSQKPGVILDQNPKPGSFIKSNRRIMLTINTISPKKIDMPYVAGFSLRQAKNKLISMGLGISKITFIKDIAANNVLSQRYNGQEVDKFSLGRISIGEEIELVVGLNENRKELIAPDIIGLSINQAKSVLWENGLNIGTIMPDHDINHDTIASAIVYHQSTLPLQKIEYGNKITFSVTIDHNKINREKKRFANRIRELNLIEKRIKGIVDTLTILRAPINNIIKVKEVITSPIDNKVTVNDLEITPTDTLRYISELNWFNFELKEQINSLDVIREQESDNISKSKVNKNK